MNEVEVRTYTLAERLCQLRTDGELTQAELAEWIGVGQNRVSDYETGKHVPQLPIIARYANIFGISLSDLFSGVVVAH